jgi:hypothetical protein
MVTRKRLFAVVHSGGQWRGISGAAVECRGPSRTEALGRGPAAALCYGARRAEPPWPDLSAAGFTRTGRFCPRRSALRGA